MKITYIRLLVEKFDDCFTFYANTIGLVPTWGKPGETYASFRVNEATMLSLFKRESMLKALKLPVLPKGANQHGFALILESDDVDVTFEYLKSKGIQTINVPHDRPEWGIRCFHLTDPEGNLIEVNKELPKGEWAEDLKNHPNAKNYPEK